MIAPTPFFADRGCHIRIAEEARFLTRHKYKVKILTYHIGKNVRGLEVERVPNFFWYRQLGSDASLHKFYIDFFLLFKTAITILSFKPTVIHCHLHEGALIGILLRPLFRGRVIFDCQSSLVEELFESGHLRKGSFVFRLIRFVEKNIYKFSQTIIVSNQYTMNELIKNFQIPRKKIHLIADGIDKTDKKVNHDRVKYFRKKMRLATGKKVIIYLGGLSRAHGIDHMISLALVLSSLRKDVLWVLGGYPNETFYRKKIAKKGLSDIMRIYGRVPSEDIYNFLSLGTHAISLKLFKTQGNLKLLHYSLAGLPIICYEQASNRAIIADKGFYLAPNQSIKNQAKSLSYFLEISEKDKKKNSRILKKYILTHFSWSEIILSLEKIYYGES
ncbi:hypothetical protein A2164_01550 [Candidatus Curtissbacteria bacterium RBG_13_35_7]|uniref:Glycosyltransferase subfamily 4-like N-terminal domain-containing protein n=1 Tax=Candidatus Curtissbacteria bacterium RBG_13_35_7 TaxID=1797705 RepID=A0A1F5G2U3_9BACT|nr:MAG: hypothetical protein A2164_01550 [Candidatus Curtissbacteria bacterium RBG_13_35_7]